MNAQQFLQKNGIAELSAVKMKTVYHFMNAFALFKVSEYRQGQFKPMREAIIEHLRMIQSKSLITISAKACLNEIESKSDEEIKQIAWQMHSVAQVASPAIKQSFGHAWSFFQTLNLTPYEYNECICNTTIPNERQWMPELPQAEQNTVRLRNSDAQGKTAVA